MKRGITVVIYTAARQSCTLAHNLQEQVPAFYLSRGSQKDSLGNFPRHKNTLSIYALDRSHPFIHVYAPCVPTLSYNVFEGARPKPPFEIVGGWLVWKGRDESERQRAESQWIVAARPLCHLQYPVAYLSRLQRILPAARWKLYFKAAAATLPPRWLGQRHVPLGAGGPYCGSASGRRAHASLLARILT